LIGRDRDATSELLPVIVQKFEAFKTGNREELPDVPFPLIAALDLSRDEWARVAQRSSWQTTRMNLNTFARHGVFDQPAITEMIAARLRDPLQIARARVFPYQLLAAYRSLDETVPSAVRAALEEAMEMAIANVPSISGPIYVCPDVSGSMRSPITGGRRGATSKVRCVDVAALVAAAFVRRNPATEVLPFEQSVVRLSLSSRDSVMTNAERLAAVGGGGTSVSAPLAELNRRKAKGDLVVIVSDNESWVDCAGARGTETMRQWNAFRARNKSARLVLIDLQPYSTTQAVEREDILNIGGFSDQVFHVISEFAAGRLSGDHWVERINSIVL